LNSQKSANSQTREDSNSVKKKEQTPASWPTHFHKPIMMSWHGICPLASSALCLSVLLPSSCTPPHQLNMRNWRKVLDFVATTANIRVINILLLLNLKHSSYWEKN